MDVRFDQHKTKQQLLHLCISLTAVLACIIYMQSRRNWSEFGRFRQSLVLPIVLAGELLKVALVRCSNRLEIGAINNVGQKFRQRRSNDVIPKELMTGVVLQVLAIILYVFICIIMGAPMLQNYEQTFMLASLLTVMTVTPTVFLLGGSGFLHVTFCEKTDIISRNEYVALELYRYNAAGAVFGAWAGSVVNPLDWERDWQVYPIPNIIGALLGSAIVNMCICSQVLYSTAKVYLNKKRT